jgi:hypothetical protein
VQTVQLILAQSLRKESLAPFGMRFATPQHTNIESRAIQNYHQRRVINFRIVGEHRYTAIVGQGYLLKSFIRPSLDQLVYVWESVRIAKDPPGIDHHRAVS